jgi:TPR repeat protein
LLDSISALVRTHSLSGDGEQQIGNILRREILPKLLSIWEGYENSAEPRKKVFLELRKYVEMFKDVYCLGDIEDWAAKVCEKSTTWEEFQWGLGAIKMLYPDDLQRKTREMLELRNNNVVSFSDGKGDKKLKYELALMVRSGAGIGAYDWIAIADAHRKQAVELLRESCGAEAFYELSRIYESGIHGVDKSEETARAYHNIAKMREREDALQTLKEKYGIDLSGKSEAPGDEDHGDEENQVLRQSFETAEEIDSIRKELKALEDELSKESGGQGQTILEQQREKYNDLKRQLRECEECFKEYIEIFERRMEQTSANYAKALQELGGEGVRIPRTPNRMRNPEFRHLVGVFGI